MQTDIPAGTGTVDAEVRGSRPARRHVTLLPWTVAAVLVFTNVAAVLSDQARSAAHDVLAPVARTVFGNMHGAFLEYRDRGRSQQVRQAAESLASQNAMLVKRRTELESTIAQLRHENSDLKARTNETDRRLRTLETAHAGLRDRHMALETERNALKDMSVRRARAVKTVADRISGKLAVNASGLIAELPVRAAPYVGVVALVTGTAFEIRSDCELARTLNGLVLEHQQAALDTHAVCQYADRIPAAGEVWTQVKNRSDTMAAPVYQMIERFYRK